MSETILIFIGGVGLGLIGWTVTTLRAIDQRISGLRTDIAVIQARCKFCKHHED